MIEKLDLDKRHSFGTVNWLENMNEPSGAKLIEQKVNQLVDAVNSIVSVQEKLIDSRFVVEIKHEEPADNSEKANCQENVQDKFAEQRKWIGKLCKFWFADAEHPIFGILDFVDTGPHPEPFHINCGESEQGWYPHCEPVKPDDDIIYKGEM